MFIANSFYHNSWRLVHLSPSFRYFFDAVPENNPYYLLLDMQLGGSWVGEIGDIGDGVSMTLDYVRVYSTPTATVPEPTSSLLCLTGLVALTLRRRRH